MTIVAQLFGLAEVFSVFIFFFSQLARITGLWGEGAKGRRGRGCTHSLMLYSPPSPSDYIVSSKNRRCAVYEFRGEIPGRRPTYPKGSTFGSSKRGKHGREGEVRFKLRIWQRRRGGLAQSPIALPKGKSFPDVLLPPAAGNRAANAAQRPLRPKNNKAKREIRFPILSPLGPPSGPSDPFA